MNRIFNFSALLISIAAFVPAAHAQVYKCVDRSGKTVYSQSPCPANAKSSAVRKSVPAGPALPADTGKTDSKGAAAKSAAPKSAAELELEFRKRRTEQEEASKKEQEKLAESKSREENCRAARGQLASLEASGRQVRMNENGERQYLDDAQIAQEKERARKAIQGWCK